MKKLAIFDFDGTMFNSVDDVVICFNEVLKKNDFPTLTYEEFIERLGGNIDEIVSLVLKNQNTPQNIELIKKEYNKLYGNSKNEHTLPFDGVYDVLRVLQQKEVFLAINSNRTTDSIKYFTGKYFEGIDFKLIEGHNIDYPSKPDPYGVLKIQKELGISCEETLYIGDSKTDIKTAINSEIDCIIVKWGYGNQKDYENDYILGTVEKADEILNYF